MNRKVMFGLLLSVCMLALVIGSIAMAKDKKPAAAQAPPEMPLPPGWTQEDMQTCAIAMTPGEMHKHLAKSAGTWTGKSKMWMFPDAPAAETTCTITNTSLMDGRYLKVDWASEMPGMGPFIGQGVHGFDNSLGKFVCTWIDSWGTGIVTGTGERSADGKSMTWKLSYTCPLTKKPAAMRQIETTTGEKTKTLVMFSNEPKSGKEFKMMEVEMTRK